MGAIGVVMIGKIRTENIGLSSIISMGNKSDISEVDLLRYLMSHKESQVILVYIEEFGGREVGQSPQDDRISFQKPRTATSRCCLCI